MGFVPPPLFGTPEFDKWLASRLRFRLVVCYAFISLGLTLVVLSFL